MQSILSATRVSIRVRVPEKKGRILIRPRRCAGAARGAAQQALAAASTNASSSLPTPAAVPDPSISIPQSSRETTSTVGVAPAQPPVSCRRQHTVPSVRAPQSCTLPLRRRSSVQHTRSPSRSIDSLEVGAAFVLPVELATQQLRRGPAGATCIARAATRALVNEAAGRANSYRAVRGGYRPSF